MSLRSLWSRAPKVRAAGASRRLTVEALESRLCMAGVPAYSSLPGAAHTIYLDFDGHTVQGTEWNTFYNQTTLTAKPFDIDGNPSTFSATELERIKEAWQRVSEDFIPFNVNVTTVDPGVEALRKTSASDTRWGVRIVVTNEATMVSKAAERTGAGGIAFVDSFTWNSDTPAWVFTTGGKSIAEAASHEAGHTLGLAHDGTATSGYYTGHGTGETGWAPIMGVGYSQNVTQWDNGSYSGTNNGGSGANFGGGADDLAVILSGNGLSYRSDDHGNFSSTASKLTTSGTSVTGAGIIERASDVDVFSFSTAGGNVSLNVKPFAVGANLDVRASVYNSAGVKVASSNPGGTLDASLSLTLVAGTYYLQVDGVGSANYSDYGSIGRYTISGTIANPLVAAAMPATTTSAPAAEFSISDIVVNENAKTATFEITLTGTITEPATVVYSTASGTAIANKDFTSKAARLTFKPGGAKVARVTVALTNDTLVEGNEHFYVNLSQASGATIANAQAVATIVDNDAPPATGSLSISSLSSTEGNVATGKKFNFAVRLDKPQSHTVTVQYQTADATATGGKDYRAVAGTLTFKPGETVKYVPVTVYGDRIKEAHESFVVLLSNPVGATLASTYAMGTMLNDDTQTAASAAPEPIVDPIHYFAELGEQTHAHDEQAGHVVKSETDAPTLADRIRNAVSRELEHADADSAAKVDAVMQRLDALFGLDELTLS